METSSFFAPILGIFLVGLTGGFAHCILMCHPFVLHVSSISIKYSIGYKILIPNLLYNLGRSTTYTFLGMLAGLLGGISTYAGKTFFNFQKSINIIGGVILITFAILYLFNARIATIFKGSAFINRLLKKHMTAPPFIYGLLLGFLPCGLSMGAIISAVACSNVLQGGIMMASFGIGTSIALMLVAILGSILMKYIKFFRPVTFVMLLIMGLYFIYQGFTL